MILRPRRHISDLQAGTYQKDFTTRPRIGVITSVNPLKGTCNINWMDTAGSKNDVLLMQANDGEWSIPNRGAYVVAIFDAKEQARIVRYVNLGHAAKVEQVILPHMREGEKLWEVGGTYVYMKANGTVQFLTGTGVELLIDAPSGGLISKSVNWKVTTTAGGTYFGLVKRLTVNADGSSSVKIISDSLTRPYTEHTLKVLEHPITSAADLAVYPLMEVTYGTLIDSTGVTVDRLAVQTALPTQEIAASIKFSSGVKITVNKNGVLNIWSAKINLNEGSIDSTDLSDLSNTNDPTLGTRGQHAAREHDAVTIPISLTYNDTEHVTQTTKNAANLVALAQLAASFVSPTGPCVFNPATLTGNLALVGEIIEGATGVIVGD